LQILLILRVVSIRRVDDEQYNRVLISIFYIKFQHIK